MWLLTPRLAGVFVAKSKAVEPSKRSSTGVSALDQIESFATSVLLMLKVVLPRMVMGILP